MFKELKTILVITFLCILTLQGPLVAQDLMPEDRGLTTYHTSPRYRPSESHPFRVLGYVMHPFGWVLREAIFRPFSYFASSTELTRSVFGYREPYDFRMAECFSTDESVPDCRAILPFNYEGTSDDVADVDVEEVNEDLAMVTNTERHVYFPDVNFDFNSRKLNDLGRGRARQIANLLRDNPGLHVVLEGHADFKGSEPYNTRLGMDRSEALRAELVGLGVDSSVISSVTFGKSRPVFQDKTDWARAVSRRVEVHLDSQAAAGS